MLQINKILLIVGFSFYLPVTFAEDNGCLTGSIKGLKLDPNCECLKTKSCQSFKNFKVSNDFLEQKDLDGKNIFSHDIKKSLKLSHEVFSKIMILKANGKANSNQIKVLYVELDRLNAETRMNLLKDNSKLFSKTIEGYNQLLKDTKIKNTERRKKMAKELNYDLKPTLASPPRQPETKTAPEPQILVEKIEKQKVQQNFNHAVISTYKDEDRVKNENAENQVILDQLKNANLEVNEEDSLFNIITKRYMKSAYPQLLDKKKNLEEAN